MGTDLIYIDESFNTHRSVVSAIGITDSAWNEVFAIVKAWRKTLRDQHGIRLAKELHAQPLLAGKGQLGPRVVPRYTRAQIFKEGLEILAACGPDKVWVINVCLTGVPGFDTLSLATERLLNRIQRCLLDRGRYGVLFFDAARERQTRRLMRKLRVYNPIPSAYGSWPEGLTKNITTDRILRDPVFVNSHEDYFVQLADFVAHALLKREEPPSDRVLRYRLHEAFEALDPILNKRASRKDPLGIVR
ncbi:MAG: DUF3800 domain-containing protein [Dehalococcoidia bacterium]